MNFTTELQLGQAIVLTALGILGWWLDRRIRGVHQLVNSQRAKMVEEISRLQSERDELQAKLAAALNPMRRRKEDGHQDR